MFGVGPTLSRRHEAFASDNVKNLWQIMLDMCGIIAVFLALTFAMPMTLLPGNGFQTDLLQKISRCKQLRNYEYF